MAFTPTNSTPALDSGRKTPPVVTDRDIIFNCPKCRGELVVDLDGAGLEVPCSHCGQPLTVPAYPSQPVVAPGPVAAAPPAAPAIAAPPATVAPPPAATTPVAAAQPPAEPAAPTPQRTFNHAELTTEQLARRWSDLKNQLKENRSQDTEMRGHVNRATIELHRLQLRLKTLLDRHGDITAELTALQTRLDQGAA